MKYFHNFTHNQPDCISWHSATKLLRSLHTDSILRCSIFLQFITFCKTASLFIPGTPDSGTLNTSLCAFFSTTRNTSRKLAVPPANCFSIAMEMFPVSNCRIVLSRTPTPIAIHCWHSSVRRRALSDFPSKTQTSSCQHKACWVSPKRQNKSWYHATQ